MIMDSRLAELDRWARRGHLYLFVGQKQDHQVLNTLLSMEETVLSLTNRPKRV